MAPAVGGITAGASVTPRPEPARGIGTSHVHPLSVAPRSLPTGVPHTGRYSFLLRLDTRPTGTTYRSVRSTSGTVAARTAARLQLARIRRDQAAVVAALPRGTSVLYRTHAALAGVAVVADVRSYAGLLSLPGVSAVYPIEPKTPSNAYAVPLQGVPAAWTAYGDRGLGASVAVIDTGVDYTHADLGGPGTVPAYQTARAADAAPVDPGAYDHSKYVGGYDLAGDAYDADPADATYHPTPAPDPNPLDCNGHGTHIAGTVAGYGENPDGSTYTGSYDDSTPFDSMRIGPGVAPLASIYAYKVFGCTGSTILVGAAVDKALDPNDDGDTSDHADVIELALGSAFGSPSDGDAVAANAAAQAGSVVVAPAGNSGDGYDVGSSPGSAVRSIAVADSVDAYSQVDALHISAPGDIAGDYAAERTIAYDWSANPDLAGDVVLLTESGNTDGCSPFSPGDAAQVAGHVAFLEWTDDASQRRCGSAQRANNAAAAGAVGFVLGNDRETFGDDIAGDDAIPGVLLSKTGADAVRAELEAAHTVTLAGTTAHGFAQFDSSLNDELNSTSSRGIAAAGEVKPDVSAVGTSVFSAGFGTGNQGANQSGTSMAAAMVAGEAALLATQHPDWTAEQIKADVMNTAGTDVFAGANHSGASYAPNRAGAGRIDVDQALANDVLAYVGDGTGAVSASFGPLAVTAPLQRTKTIKVQNTGSSTRQYGVGYQPITTIPGVSYSLSTDTVTLDPHSSQSVTLTLTVDPSLLTKTVDPTVSATVNGLARQFMADASGLVVLTGSGVPDLRVPVYSAPRPASTMTQASSLTLPTGTVQKALLPLSGHGVDQGSGATLVRSTVAGFELQATSGKAPACSATVTSRCIRTPDDRIADVKYVGATSDAPQLTSIGKSPLSAGLAYFAVATQRPWHAAVGNQTFVVWIDSNRDGKADAKLVTARLDDDIPVTELIDLPGSTVSDVELVNASFGDTDTAIFDSDVLVLPVWLGALPGLTANSSRVNYVVTTYSGSTVIDSVGTVNPSTRAMHNPLSLDVLRPGVAIYGSYDGHASPLLFVDSPGSVLAVRRDAPAYKLDHGRGALLVHFHNLVGSKAQVMHLPSPTATTLKPSVNPVTAGRTLTLTATVTSPTGVPTGTVKYLDGTTSLGTRSLRNGKAALSTSRLKAGTHKLTVVFLGTVDYRRSTSAVCKEVVRKP